MARLSGFILRNKQPFDLSAMTFNDDLSGDGTWRFDSLEWLDMWMEVTQVGDQRYCLRGRGLPPAGIAGAASDRDVVTFVCHAPFVVTLTM
jgi:hypothetical protein